MKSRGTCRRLDHHKGGYEQGKSCTHDQTSAVWCKLCTWNYVEAWLAFWFATRRLHGSAASRSAAHVSSRVSGGAPRHPDYSPAGKKVGGIPKVSLCRTPGSCVREVVAKAENKTGCAYPNPHSPFCVCAPANEQTTRWC